MSVQKLLELWQKPITASADEQFVHPSDQPVLERWIAGAKLGKSRTTRAQEASDFGKRTGQLHLCLTPMPYVGNLRSAKIIIAMINPTVGWQDYLDHRNAEFMKLRESNMLQKVDTCFALEPASKQAPHGSWSNYYGGLFNGFVAEYGNDLGGSRELRTRLAQESAILELVPYYSQNATMLTQDHLHESLVSAQVALAAMQEIAGRGDTLIICRWASALKRWNLQEKAAGHKARIVCSESRSGLQRSAKEALAAHLGARG